MVVGVAGKYCAGKSTVSALLEVHGYHPVDVDALGHEALKREKSAVVAHFGEEIVSPDGSVDRGRLGRIVFADRAARSKLEAIVHPVMRQMTRERVAAAGRQKVVINAAILFEMRLDELCDKVLWVTAPLLVRMRRARRRDGMSLRRLLARLRAQRRMRPQSSAENVDIEIVSNWSNDTALLAASLRELELI